MDGAQLTKRNGIPSGTRRRVHLHGEIWIAQGDVGGATHIFMVNQTSPIMMLETPFAGMGRRRKVDGSWSGVADDLFIKDVLPDVTADSPKDVVLNHSTTRRQRIDTSKTFASWRSCRASVDMVSKDDSHHWTRLERSWVEPGLQR